jgi:FAD/FMN-containing dehydrogenase
MYLHLLWFSLAPLSIAAFIDHRARQTAITDCLTNASVPQDLPGTTDFTQAIEPFNLRVPFTPVAVAVPTTVSQVQAAVSCGASLGVFVSPKSGGHSYASHGLGGENGHLMVDMKYFFNVTLDNSTGIATVGPGAYPISQSIISSIRILESRLPFKMS